MTTTELIKKIADAEAGLQNVRTTATFLVEKRLPGESQGHMLNKGTVRSVFPGRPGSEFRVERDVLAVWIDGPSPFLRDVSTTVFDGRVRKTLTSVQGDPGGNWVVVPPRGEVLAGRGTGAELIGTGWQFSLYGLLDTTQPSERLSRHLEGLAASDSGRLVVARVPQSGSFCWEATFERNQMRYTWSFDPEHGYAIRHHRSSREGKAGFTFDVDELIEAAAGVFYPAHMTRVVVGKGAETRTEVRVSDASANTDLPEDVFSITWPPRTRVQDHVSGTTFTVD